MKIITDKVFLEMPWSMEDTIENLRDIKVMMQQILCQANKDGKGEEDAKEVAFDFDRAIAALERQIPKKIEEKRYIYTLCECGYEFSKHHGDGYYSIPYEKQTKYCPNCGQALDWGQEE